MERAVENHYKATLTAPRSSSGGPRPPAPVSSLSHERLGAEIIRADGGVGRVLRDHGISPDEVVAIILHEPDEPRFANLVSSDLDVDRLDYLLRTAASTGLPYGNVDLEYLVSQLRLDPAGRLCFDRRAIRTAEHLLLARYFDYQQVSFHKTVVAIELLLESVLEGLFVDGRLDCSADRMKAEIASGAWREFDDSRVLSLVRDMASDAGSAHSVRARALLGRRLPKLIASIEFFDRRDPGVHSGFQAEVALARGWLGEWASALGLPEDDFLLWLRPIPITKAAAHTPASSARDEAVEQAVHIYDDDGRPAVPLEEIPESLMSVLADQQMYNARLYALLPEGEAGRDVRADLTARVLADLRETRWR